jgi:hypothetical protein
MNDNLENKNDFPEEPFKASAEEWSREEPTSPQSTQNSQGTDRWGSPQHPGSDDPNRWQNVLYSPEADQPSNQRSRQTPETVVITEPKTGTTATKKDGDFPVWAIVLIVLLVLALCVLCPVLLVLGGVISLFQGALILLPFI